MSRTAVIELEKLSKRYKGSKDWAVREMDLLICEGELFGFLGPNGAGKTTTISILSGLLEPTGGSVRIHGMDIRSHRAEIKKIIGVVPQEIALYPTLSAMENLVYFGSLYGLHGRALRKMIKDYLRIFSLEKAADKWVEQLSGGMKRRINLIAGLLHHPKILILDEPTAGIDVQSRQVILEFLKKINDEGTTIIYTSHYMEEAEQLCSRVAIVDGGKVLAVGSPGELISGNPQFRNLETIFLHYTGRETRD